MSRVLLAPSEHKRARRRGVVLLLGVVLLASGLAAWLFWLRPAKYEASALVHFEWPPPRLLPEPAAPTPGEVYYQTQAALVKSRLVLTAALRGPKAASLALLQDKADALEWLEQNLKVGYPGLAGVMEIALSADEHAGDLPVLVDLVTQAYLQEVAFKDRNRRHGRLDMLKQVAATYQANLKRLRELLRQHQEKVGPGDSKALAVREDLARAEYEQVKSELIGTRKEIRTLAIRKEMLDWRGDKGQGDGGAALQARRAELEEKLASLKRLEQVLETEVERLAAESKRFTKDTPDLPDIQREHDAKEETLKALNKEINRLQVDLESPSAVTLLQEAVLRSKRTKQQ
jgi:uncharacterized protein involved in exopolysaccharide biosynthesis